MLLSNPRKVQSRKFSFTPFYYQNRDESEREFEKRNKRIQFKRFRRQPISQKSFRIKVVFALLLLIFLYYFRGLVFEDQRDFDLDSLRIEETPVFEN